MEKYIKEFPQHLIDGVEIARKIKIENIDINQVKNILLCGLGGSGIGATIIKNYASSIAPMHIDIVKDYSIPAYVSEDTLVILCSYSGNTEETLTCLQLALKANAQIIVVTSGGQLLDSAQQLNLDVFQVPSGFQPRAALAYSIVMLMNIFYQLNLLDEDVNLSLEKISSHLYGQQEQIIEKAQSLSDTLLGKLPIIYSEGKLEGVAIRWCQQINENSKMPCYHHVIPEMNHNELVALKSFHPQMHYLLLRHNFEYSKNVKRFDFLIDEMNALSIPYTEVVMEGENVLTVMLSLIHLGDWVSFFLSQKQSLDPNKVEIIDRLKQYMSE